MQKITIFALLKGLCSSMDRMVRVLILRAARVDGFSGEINFNIKLKI